MTRYHNPLLEVAVRDWIGDTSKSHAHDGLDNDRERRIIALAEGCPPPTSRMIHRGQGIPDEAIAELRATGRTTLQPSMRLISSWSTSIEVAYDFAKDAADDGHCAVVISLPSTDMQVVVDTALLAVDASEREIIVLSRPIELTMENVSTIWRYDDKTERSEVISVATMERIQP